MKVLFLDHDGVICLSNNWGSRFKKQKKEGITIQGKDMPLNLRFDDFDTKSVKVLNTILEITDAEIVVSSDWKKWANTKELGDYYESQGIIKRPIDTTPFFRDLDHQNLPKVSWERDSELEVERHFEILNWLSKHKEINNWVAVDDLNMSFGLKDEFYGERDWGLTNFVWTPRSNEGIKQLGIKEKIINYLK